MHVSYRIVRAVGWQGWSVQRRAGDAGTWRPTRAYAEPSEAAAVAHMRKEMSADRDAASRLGVEVWTEVEGEHG